MMSAKPSLTRLNNSKKLKTTLFSRLPTSIASHRVIAFSLDGSYLDEEHITRFPPSFETYKDRERLINIAGYTSSFFVIFDFYIYIVVNKLFHLF